MSRGVLYLVWGDYNQQSLKRSIASLQHWHPELEHRVVTMPDSSNVLCKSQMYDLSPFEETLYLDADTTVMGRLDYGFAQAMRFGMALCINCNPWNRRYHNLRQEPDAVEYSSGVVFFVKHGGTERIFNQWHVNKVLDSSCRYVTDSGEIKEQKYNDQALLTLALAMTGNNPFVLPPNWNLHPRWQKTFWGELKILHGYSDIPRSLLRWNEEQSKPDAVIRCVSLPGDMT